MRLWFDLVLFALLIMLGLMAGLSFINAIILSIAWYIIGRLFLHWLGSL